MRDRRDRSVGISGEVDPSLLRRKSEQGTKESRVHVREPVVLLPPKGGRLDVVQRRVLVSPLGLLGHLDELGILLDHRGHDTKERLPNQTYTHVKPTFTSEHKGRGVLTS